MNIEVHGELAPGLEAVKQAFEDNWNRIEVGASLCVYHKGKKIVDLWGGFQDRDLSRPWKKETLVNIYSATKGVVSLALANLFDEGKLNYQARVTDYWPEFGQAGKQGITVAQLLSHQAGLCGVEEKLSVEDLYTHKKMVHLLEQQRPLWPPGESSGYHPVTWGFLAGELILRITGLTTGQYIQEKVTGPLKADFFLGLPESEMGRVADMIGPNHARVKPVSSGTPAEESSSQNTEYFAIASLNPLISPFKHASSNAWRRAEIPSANGQSNARGMATIYGAMANKGKLGKVRLISEKAIEEATLPEVNSENDRVLNKPLGFSRGFMLNKGSQFGPNIDSYGHDGAGGSLGFADPKENIGFAYVMNQMEADSTATPRSTLLVDALYSSLLSEKLT